MEKVLNSIFVRLNVNLQNLTGKALAQLIVKILYSSDNSMSKSQIKSQLSQVNGCKRISDVEVDNLLASLTPLEIKCTKGQYYLSSAKKTKIQESLDKATKRNEAILQKYFSRLNSNPEDIKNWLTDATIKFFEAYSEEWISDLKAKTNHVSSSEGQIRQLVENLTNTNRRLDSDDKKRLPKLFFDFINTVDSDVDDYLWEFGTSAFASKLIRTMHGVDEFTLETFRNSHCIFDTNILMFIALESRFKDAFESIEKVFKDLNIKSSILYITKQEYEGRIAAQKRDTLKNLSIFGSDLSLLPNDDFTNYAKILHCRDEDAFTRFFDETLQLPKYIHDSVKISLYDSNLSLQNAIEKAQSDDSLKKKLNDLYKKYANHDKSHGSLNHDIGLLEGVKSLRNSSDTKEEKFFILSEEISVNQYSKESAFSMNLPLALRVDTLINLLAVNNGGDTFNASDYSPLFANIIRQGLIPQKDTFRQTELYQYYQMDSRISGLPQNTIQDIVVEMHKKMMDGEKEDELLRDLNELVTEGEIKMNDELVKTKSDLHFTEKELNTTKEQNAIYESLLRSEIHEKVSKEYDEETKRLNNKYKRNIPLLILAASVVIFIGMTFGCSNVPFWVTLVFAILINIVSAVLLNLYADRKLLNDRKEHRDSDINRRVEEEIKQKLSGRNCFRE